MYSFVFIITISIIYWPPRIHSFIHHHHLVYLFTYSLMYLSAPPSNFPIPLPTFSSTHHYPSITHLLIIHIHSLSPFTTHHLSIIVIHHSLIIYHHPSLHHRIHFTIHLSFIHSLFHSFISITSFVSFTSFASSVSLQYTIHLLTHSIHLLNGIHSSLLDSFIHHSSHCNYLLFIHSLIYSFAFTIVAPPFITYSSSSMIHSVYLLHLTTRKCENG